jgi:hypothetical protein
MEPFEFAGARQDGSVVWGSGPSARLIAGGEAGRAVGAVKVPDLPHGVVGQLEFSRDGGEFLTELTTTDDLLTDGQGQGAWHGGHSEKELLNPVPRGDRSHENSL